MFYNPFNIHGTKRLECRVDMMFNNCSHYGLPINEQNRLVKCRLLHFDHVSIVCDVDHNFCLHDSLRSKRFRFVLEQIKKEEGQSKTARKSCSLVSLCSETKRKRLLRRLFV